MAAGTARLRDELFDVVLISHEPEELDALELAQGLASRRIGIAGSGVGHRGRRRIRRPRLLRPEPTPTCASTARRPASLLWTAARAIERSRLLRENHRLVTGRAEAIAARTSGSRPAARRATRADRRIAGRRHWDRAAAGRCFRRAIPRRFPSRLAFRSIKTPMPGNLVTHYADLLRAYVIMGSGNLAAQMRALGGIAGRGRSHAAANDATALAGVGRPDRRLGQPQCPACDHPSGSVGAGSDDAPGRRLSDRVSRPSVSAAADWNCRGLGRAKRLDAEGCETASELANARVKTTRAISPCFVLKPEPQL